MKRSTHPKRLSNSALIGQMGINIIEAVVLQMGCLWSQTRALDAGVDGTIEIRDATTGEVSHNLIRVQSKATTRPFRRDKSGHFEYLCDQRDVAYWRNSPIPVILVVSRVDTREAYWICIQEYFVGTPLQERRIIFDKLRDKFDITAAQRLRMLATSPLTPLARKAHKKASTAESYVCRCAAVVGERIRIVQSELGSVIGTSAIVTGIIRVARVSVRNAPACCFALPTVNRALTALTINVRRHAELCREAARAAQLNTPPNSSLTEHVSASKARLAEWSIYAERAMVQRTMTVMGKGVNALAYPKALFVEEIANRCYLRLRGATPACLLVTSDPVDQVVGMPVEGILRVPVQHADVLAVFMQVCHLVATVVFNSRHYLPFDPLTRDRLQLAIRDGVTAAAVSNLVADAVDSYADTLVLLNLFQHDVGSFVLSFSVEALENALQVGLDAQDQWVVYLLVRLYFAVESILRKELIHAETGSSELDEWVPHRTVVAAALERIVGILRLELFSFRRYSQITISPPVIHRAIEVVVSSSSILRRAYVMELLRAYPPLPISASAANSAATLLAGGDSVIDPSDYVDVLALLHGRYVQELREWPDQTERLNKLRKITTSLVNQFGLSARSGA